MTEAEFRFDDRAIGWQVVEYIGASIHVLSLEAGLAQVLIRFAAGVRGRLHRHTCAFSTLVLQGELQFWRADGTWKETRPVASLVQVAADGPPHREGAGNQVGIVLFTFHGAGDAIHYLDDAGGVAFRLGFDDFRDVLARQGSGGAAVRTA